VEEEYVRGEALNDLTPEGVSYRNEELS